MNWQGWQGNNYGWDSGDWRGGGDAGQWQNYNHWQDRQANQWQQDQWQDCQDRQDRWDRWGPQNGRRWDAPGRDDREDLRRAGGEGGGYAEDGFRGGGGGGGGGARGYRPQPYGEILPYPQVRPEVWLQEHDVHIVPRSRDQVRFVCICLHTCSGGPDDFMAFIHRLNPDLRRHAKFVIPCSPVLTEDWDGHESSQNSWFRYRQDHPNEIFSQEELNVARTNLMDLTSRELRLLRNNGGDSSGIIFWGLSQGAALATDLALRFPTPVGGVLAQRGMALPLSSMTDVQPRPDLGTVKGLSINGGYDTMCPDHIAVASYRDLQRYGLSIATTVVGQLGHAAARGRQQLNDTELGLINGFFADVFGMRN